MPRRKNSTSVTSAFRRVQVQARALLADLRKQIRGKEAELRRLKEATESYKTAHEALGHCLLYTSDAADE